MSRKSSFFSRLFGRATSDSERNLGSGSVERKCQDSGSSSEGASVEVWLHPDAEELKKQTLLQARRIEQDVFLIGRRTSETVAYPYDNAPDMLLFESSPYTLSKLQCQIEISGSQVTLRDLGSRSGTILGKKRLISRKRKPTSMVVPKGSHPLILGHSDGPFHFRLVVS